MIAIVIAAALLIGSLDCSAYAYPAFTARSGEIELDGARAALRCTF